MATYDLAGALSQRFKNELQVSGRTRTLPGARSDSERSAVRCLAPDQDRDRLVAHVGQEPQSDGVLGSREPAYITLSQFPQCINRLTSESPSMTLKGHGCCMTSAYHMSDSFHVSRVSSRTNSRVKVALAPVAPYEERDNWALQRDRSRSVEKALLSNMQRFALPAPLPCVPATSDKRVHRELAG